MLGRNSIGSSARIVSYSLHLQLWSLLMYVSKKYLKERFMQTQKINISCFIRWLCRPRFRPNRTMDNGREGGFDRCINGNLRSALGIHLSDFACKWNWQWICRLHSFRIIEIWNCQRVLFFQFAAVFVCSTTITRCEKSSFVKTKQSSIIEIKF